MTYEVIKYIKGNPYRYLVKSVREGERVRQVFVRYLGRADKPSREDLEVVPVARKEKRVRLKPVSEMTAEELGKLTLARMTYEEGKAMPPPTPTAETLAPETIKLWQAEGRTPQDTVSMRQLPDGRFQITPSYNEQTKGIERQYFDTKDEALEVLSSRGEIKEYTKPAPPSEEIVSTPETAKDYIIKKEPEPLLPSGFKYMVYQSDDTPMYISGATPEEATSKLKQGHKVASITLEGEPEGIPPITLEVTRILEDVISKQSKASFHGQRIASDLGEGIRALREGSVDGAIATIEETLSRPGISKKNSQSLNDALSKLKGEPAIPKAEVVTPTAPVEPIPED